MSWVSGMIFSLVLVVLAESPASTNTDGANRAVADLDGADYSILGSLMVHRNKESKYLCTQSPYACIGVDRAELGMALIAWSSDKSSPRRLTELVKYRLDAGPSADHKCYLIYRRDAVLRSIEELDVQALHKKCASDFDVVLKRSAAKFGLEVGQICRTPSEIRKEFGVIKKMLREGSECE